MTNNKFYQKLIYSKSPIAVILRLLAWVLLIAAVVVGVVDSIADSEPMPLMDYLLQAADKAHAQEKLKEYQATLNSLAN